MTPQPGAEAPPLAVVVKGWPRLSETFIAQELAGLEARGLRLAIWSLRAPTDARTHPLHASVRAPVHYLPEYLHHAPRRVLAGLGRSLRLPGFGRALRLWLRDLGRDRSRNRIRRFGQACVLAAELPAGTPALYAHFLHTPASVARYAAVMRGLPWAVSAHAKDIWTSPAWEKREKLADARAGAALAVTCTAVGAAHLQGLADRSDRVSLLYHGLDLRRFPPPPASRPARDGRGEPVEILCVGRLVEKKGVDRLIEALALLPAGLSWRFTHLGGGGLQDRLAARAAELGISGRIRWAGPATQPEVIAAMRAADLFVLPSRTAADGDRDGLPNVLMEAASQRLPIIATPVAAIPEFVTDGVEGTLVPDDPPALAAAIAALIADPARRMREAEAAHVRLQRDFGAAAGLDRLAAMLRGLTVPSGGAQGEGTAQVRAAE
jgi:glycosyltransferase involved in cell wall biosynthesis